MARRLFFTALLVAAGLLILEAASWIGFRVLDGQWFSYSRLDGERATLARAPRPESSEDAEIARPAGAPPVELSPEALAREIRRAGGREVLHPFLGFVFNRELNRIEERRKRGMLEITRHGFFRAPEVWRDQPRGLGADEADLTVAFFGGSVSMVLSFAARQPFLDRLAQLPATAGTRVAVESYALGSFKQPQQLQALTYLLSQGQRFDAVINLDGFNEVALTWAHNRPQHEYFAFPRDWSARSARRPDPTRQRLAGEIAYWQDRRRRLAERGTPGPLRWSVTANLLWHWRDRRMATRLAAVEARLAATPRAENPFEGQGAFEPAPDDEAYFRAVAENWARGSLLMERLCTASGIAYLHLLQPNQYLPGSKPLSRQERQTAWRQDQPYRPAVEMGYPRLLEAAGELRRQGVAFVDASLLFDGVGETLYEDTCCHLNAAGNRRLAHFVAERLAERLEDISREEREKPTKYNFSIPASQNRSIPR